MAIELWTNPSPGTGRDHFSKALINSFREGNLDLHMRKVGINFIHGKVRKGFFGVLRVDGVYYDQPRMGQNIPIKRSISSHDLVIYQSEFSRIFAERMLGVTPRRSCVIHNGTAMQPIGGQNRKPVIVASARWRPNKRPRAIAEAFAIAHDTMRVDAELHMIGDVDGSSRVDHPKILYRGSMSHGEMRLLFSSAKLMVHICHLDSCPNSVVECLRMGVPVLCNNIGGTQEVVGSSGCTVPIDKEFNFIPLASMNQVGDDSVDRLVLADGIRKAYESAVQVERADLDIARCAERYIREIKHAMQS